MRKNDHEQQAGKTNLITREGRSRLQEEYDFLWERERPRIVQEVSDAAAEGDRSENAS